MIIENAKDLFPFNSDFKVGVIGEVDYKEKFDVIISMDTIYFAKDMTSFVSQVKQWLKENGVFFVGYQEGEVMSKTESAKTTVLAKALEQNEMNFEVMDITEQTYELLKKKRVAALLHKEEFEAEGHRNWFDMLIAQTECADKAFEQFKEEMARYIFVVKKKDNVRNNFVPNER